MAGDKQNGTARRMTKNEKKRAKKKALKQAKAREEEEVKEAPPPPEDEAPPPPDDVQVEYVSASVSEEDPLMAQFKGIFDKFATAEELTASLNPEAKSNSGPSTTEGAEGKDDGAVDGNGGAAGDGEDETGEKKLSRKARKKQSRLSVAELKQLVSRPDVVEAHDVTAADPRLLVFLKGYRNTVPVPRHWCHKRKYLQGKRGIDKPPFQLPEFIASTGIEKIRTAIMEQEALASAKQKGRARVQPKMGKIDIDYQVLHDAFFKYQKKPLLTLHGDIYYEGKEFEVKLREKKPGQLSEQLKNALGMPENSPPPWLINMQRYGPPPSYPNLKIPGLNAPIPEGASFGYHPGGWGKPPVDEYNRPVYGDVFGRAEPAEAEQAAVDRSLWGELGSEESEEEESEEESEEEMEDAMEDGMETPSGETGITSVVSGLETPESVVDLRKRAGTDTPDTSGIPAAPKELYQVVQEKSTKVGAGVFGTDKKYVLPTGEDGSVAMNPEEAGEQVPNEDFLKKSNSDADDEGLSEEQRKRKRKAEKDNQAKKKKFDDFKF